MNKVKLKAVVILNGLNSVPLNKKLFILLFGFSPFIFSAMCNFPSADDFAYGIGQKPINFVAVQNYFYFNWSGRYSSTFFISLFMQDSHFYICKIVPILF